MRLTIAPVFIIVMLCQTCWATQVANVRMWSLPDATRVVFYLSQPIKYRTVSTENPHRVIVDMQGAELERPVAKLIPQDKYLARLRSAPQDSGQLRFVLDLHRPVQARSYLLAPDGKEGYRLVVDVTSKAQVTLAVPQPIPAIPRVSVAATSHHISPPSTTVPLHSSYARRPTGITRPVTAVASHRTAFKGRTRVVAVDAGHGGQDPGAHGMHGVNEKDVTLAIARKLATLINQTPGMRGVLIRDGDYYIGLRERFQKARQHKADLFISIHADAYKDPTVAGSSVYVLSERGASSEAARWLAERENSADLIGGVSLDDKDHLLKSVLLDLSQTASLDASIDLANRVLTRLNRVGEVRKRSVQRAGFMVLKSPDIPSILIETAYLTNPEEEQNLIEPYHQQALAEAILDGIRAYFRYNDSPGSYLAEQKNTDGSNAN